MTGAASQAYGEAWYWDERYRKEAGPFDWYQKYPALAPLLRLHVAPHQRLLLAGRCGNSGESSRVGRVGLPASSREACPWDSPSFIRSESVSEAGGYGLDRSGSHCTCDVQYILYSILPR
jgi:hypothetical protein